jgi:hypothetical protein
MDVQLIGLEDRQVPTPTGRWTNHFALRAQGDMALDVVPDVVPDVLLGCGVRPQAGRDVPIHRVPRPSDLFSKVPLKAPGSR